MWGCPTEQPPEGRPPAPTRVILVLNSLPVPVLHNLSLFNAEVHLLFSGMTCRSIVVCPGSALWYQLDLISCHNKVSLVDCQLSHPVRRRRRSIPPYKRRESSFLFFLVHAAIKRTIFHGERIKQRQSWCCCRGPRGPLAQSLSAASLARWDRVTSSVGKWIKRTNDANAFETCMKRAAAAAPLLMPRSPRLLE